MSGLMNTAARFLRSEDGPTAVEYAVLLAIIAVGVLASMQLFGVHMGNIYTNVTTGVDVF